jgi:hypothetical protein
MNSGEERRLKQELLKSEILDKGYNVENFMTFMDERKPNGIPLNLLIKRDRPR